MGYLRATNALRRLLPAAALISLVAAAPAQASSASAPKLQAPANHVSVQSLPDFTWASVKGASTYEFEFAADTHFASGVDGFGTGTVALTTTAITSDKAIPDGTYYWRVRAVSASDQPGPWSSVRTLTKAWTTAPQLVSPIGATTVSWPGNPLDLRWSVVPHADEYDVFVATDPALSHLVVGSVTAPFQVEGPQFTIPSVLAPGTYYWAIQPVDAEGDVGKRSAVGTFTWSWPSQTTVSELDDSAAPSVVEPQFNWAAVAGAASYEIEISRAQDFASGSDVIDDPSIAGDSYTPTSILPNETDLYWRVRARDSGGDAGAWNVGKPFEESFDELSPTISNLRVVDQYGNTLTPGTVTADPIITWDPVPGASSYNVQVSTWTQGVGCQFSNSQTLTTANTALTFNGSNSPSSTWEPAGWPGPNAGGGLSVEFSGGSNQANVCVRVSAKRDDGQLGGGQVDSAATQIGTTSTPAFVYPQPTTNAGTLQGDSVGTGSYYVNPAPGSTTNVTTTPIFEWNPVPGAAGYYVVISYDPYFTNIVPSGVGYTQENAWAAPISLLDETNAYYWEVIPVDAAGDVLANPQDASDNDPQSFDKSSIPPAPLAPTVGATVETQPTFSWASAQGARNYTLQIAGDPSFANPVEQITTDSTSYTANQTLPADATLYWRVRANDLNGSGLNWSTVSTFTHHLPSPTLSATNPISGDQIPLIAWSPVSGAISYNWSVVQANGMTATGSTAVPYQTPAAWYGTGVSHEQIQAVFPGGATSAYSATQAFTHTIPAPSGVHATKAGSRIVISWATNNDAKQYEIQLSTTPGFAVTVATDTTDNNVWVPQITAAIAAHKLYWRLANLDGLGNIGAYASGIFTAPHKASKAKKHKGKGYTGVFRPDFRHQLRRL